MVPASAHHPYEKGHYHRVFALQEIHFLLKFDKDDRPLPIELADRLGNRFWVHPDDWNIAISPHNLEWQFDIAAE